MTFFDFIDKYIKAFGITSITIIICFAFVILYKFVLSPAILKYSEYKIEKSKLQLNAIIDAQAAASNRIYELQMVKINLALPILQDISSDLYTFRMMYNSYLRCILNGVSFSDKEDARVELDIKFTKEISQIFIYIPDEMRSLLQKLRIFISCYWKDSDSICTTINESIFKKSEISKNVYKILKDYINCFYDMVSIYCNLTKENKTFADICSKHNIDINGQYLNDTPISKFSLFYILKHEYQDPELYEAMESVWFK
ncbi:MAG: hypothetical protein ACYDG2_13505 [Ruminiclostridium sp.]